MRTRYDGTDCLRVDLVQTLENAFIIPVCPEHMANLPTPRPRAEITGGDGRSVIEGTERVLDEDGRDVTASFIKGAREVLDLATNTGATLAILKEGSPSCGVNNIKRKGETVAGPGVTTALLEKAGIEVRGVE